MILVYTPRGSTKRKSKVHLQEVVTKYLTNDRYDQRKSDMVAVAHKEQLGKVRDEQAKKRAWLTVTLHVYNKIERLFDNVCAQEIQPQNPQAPSLVRNPHMLTHGSRKRKKEVKGNVHA